MNTKKCSGCNRIVLVIVSHIVKVLASHFGLGEATVADEVHIRWPSGEETTLTDVAADRYYVVIEGFRPVAGSR